MSCQLAKFQQQQVTGSGTILQHALVFNTSFYEKAQRTGFRTHYALLISLIVWLPLQIAIGTIQVHSNQPTYRGCYD